MKEPSQNVFSLTYLLTLKRRLIRKSLKWNELLLKRPVKISGFILTIVVISWLTSGHSISSFESKINGGILREDLVAPEEFVLIDKKATTERQQEAVDQVPPVFEYDSSLREHIQNRISTSFEEARTVYIDLLRKEFNTNELTKNILTSPKYKQFISSLASQKPSIFSLTNDTTTIEFLAYKAFDKGIEKELLQLTALTLNDFIYFDAHATQAQSRRLIYRDTITGTQHEILGYTVISLSVAQNRVKEAINSLQSLSTNEKEIIYKLLIGIIQPNLRYSPILTNEAREKAIQSVPEVTSAYKRNQMIARTGDPVTPYIESVITYLNEKQRANNPFVRFLSILGIISIVMIVIYKFTYHSSSELKLAPERAFTLICLTLITQTVFIWVGVNISQHFNIGTNFIAGLSPYEFAIPYAAATLVIAFLLDENLAIFCTLLVSLIAGLMVRENIGICVYAALNGCTAAYSVRHYRQRNSVIKAGLFIGLINLALVTAIRYTEGSTITSKEYLIALACGGIGGLITAAYASFTIPISESLFDILTDVKLLELSNVDLPLLRELAIHAPGTQQHSIMVSSLAQEAAEAIGANALLVKIGCYYHDIGKLLAPEMFIENQTTGPNPHDSMDTRRSASVITGHVRKGIIMGREAGLPEQILDLIPQHHGTRKLHYFYTKALEQAAITGEKIEETDYRYPGPKPQTREAAIVMLADSAEAAARSLIEPTYENVSTIVKKIIDDLIADGQLSECNITMREITIVRNILIKTLCNIYHHRITYPGFNTNNLDSEEIGLTSNKQLSQAIKPSSI